MRLKLVNRDFYGKLTHEETLACCLYPAEAEYAVRHLSAKPQTLVGVNCAYEIEDEPIREDPLLSWRPLETGQRWTSPFTGMGGTIEQADNREPSDRVVFMSTGGIRKNWSNAEFRGHYPHLAEERRPYVNEYWRSISHPNTNAHIYRVWKIEVTIGGPCSWFVEYAEDRGSLKGARTVTPLRQFHEKYEPRELKWDRHIVPIQPPVDDQITANLTAALEGLELEQSEWESVQHLVVAGVKLRVTVRVEVDDD